MAFGWPPIGSTWGSKLIPTIPVQSLHKYCKTALERKQVSKTFFLSFTHSPFCFFSFTFPTIILGYSLFWDGVIPAFFVVISPSERRWIGNWLLGRWVLHFALFCHMIGLRRQSFYPLSPHPTEKISNISSAKFDHSSLRCAGSCPRSQRVFLWLLVSPRNHDTHPRRPHPFSYHSTYGQLTIILGSPNLCVTTRALVS